MMHKYIEGIMTYNNSYDLIWIMALTLKESGAATETIAVSIGTDKTVDTLRTALAMGVDRAIFIKTESELDLQPLHDKEVLNFNV